MSVKSTLRKPHMTKEKKLPKHIQYRRQFLNLLDHDDVHKWLFAYDRQHLVSLIYY